MTQNHSQTPKQKWLPRAFADTWKAFLSRGKGEIAARAKNGQISPSGASGLGEIVLPAARHRWQLPVLRTLTPSVLESILREAATGSSPRREHELYDLMVQTWPRLAKNIAEIKNGVLGLDWTIRHPGEPDPAAEELVSRARLGMRGDPVEGTLGWEGTLRHLLDGWFRGVAMVEIVWQATPHGIVPAATRPIPAWHFGWPRETGRLMLYPEPGRPESAMEIPREKFLIAIHNTGGGHPSTGALLRPLVWWWLASNFSAEWFLNYAQIFGQPYRWATYSRGDAEAAGQLAKIMEEMGAAGWGIGPEGTTMQFLSASTGSADNPQAALLDRADRVCDILLLGQTLTTDVGQSGSRALGEVHSGVRADIIDAAASWLAEVLNEQLIPALFALHTGQPADPSALPWWEASRKQSRDTKLTAEVIEILTRAGLPIPQAWAYDVLDIPAPQAGEAVITPPAQVGAAPDLAPALAAMPVEARAYVLAKLADRSV